MNEFTKGETFGGFVQILAGKNPIALVHPKYVNKFLASEVMYEALKAVLPWAQLWIDYLREAIGKGQGKGAEEIFLKANQALAQAERKL